VELMMRVRLKVDQYWPEGLTIEALAQQLGMNRRAVGALKRGTYRGEWTTLVKLSRAFGVPIEKLLEIEED